MNSKQIVQIAIVVLGLLIAAVSFALFNPFKPTVDLADTITLVDVETGTLYRVSVRRRGIAPPLRSPETEKLSLIPITEQDGQWSVRDRYVPVIEREGIESDVWDQLQSGSFLPASTDAKMIEPKY